MSWLSENYDKAALGVAAVAAIAVGYSIFSGGDEVAQPKAASPNNTVEIPQRKILESALEKFAAKKDFESKVSNGNEVQSFVSFPLYSVKDQEGIKSLTDDFEIHSGMPLKWWKGYGLEDYKQEDGPDLDADGDGFTNREEFDGKTDPTDKTKHPDLIAKLKCTGAKAQEYSINWTKWNAQQGNFSFRLNGRSSLSTLGVGGKFPERCKNKSFIHRFEVIEKGQDPDIAGEQGEYFVLQDNGENQNKKQFKLYYNKRTTYQDWTVTFLLGIAESDAPFSVPEGGSFSLPYDSESKSKTYQFKSKKESKAEIEYEANGQKSSVELDIPASK